MPVTKQDLELFAARIRPHFKPELRDIAYELALGIAQCVGAKAKLLRPETTMREVFEWFNAVEPFPTSLDQVEFVMALEEEFEINIPDEVAAKHEITFRDMVLVRAGKRRAA